MSNTKRENWGSLRKLPSGRWQARYPGLNGTLLVAELSFTPGSIGHNYAKVAILTASVLAAVLAAVLLGIRNRQYGRIRHRDRLDANQDGIPDVYQDGSGAQPRG